MKHYHSHRTGDTRIYHYCEAHLRAGLARTSLTYPHLKRANSCQEPCDDCVMEVPLAGELKIHCSLITSPPRPGTRGGLT